jgi:SCP-2 sterol transfer family
LTAPDLVDAFFGELASRGHDPLLDELESTGRFEISDGGRVEQWLVSVKGGYITVSHGGGDADWVVHADRTAFERVIRTETSVLAAHIRGTLDVTMTSLMQRLGLIRRIFAGRPESREQQHPG